MIAIGAVQTMSIMICTAIIAIMSAVHSATIAVVSNKLRSP